MEEIRQAELVGGKVSFHACLYVASRIPQPDGGCGKVSLGAFL